MPQWFHASRSEFSEYRWFVFVDQTSPHIESLWLACSLQVTSGGFAANVEHAAQLHVQSTFIVRQVHVHESRRIDGVAPQELRHVTSSRQLDTGTWTGTSLSGGASVEVRGLAQHCQGSTIDRPVRCGESLDQLQILVAAAASAVRFRASARCMSCMSCVSTCSNCSAQISMFSCAVPNNNNPQYCRVLVPHQQNSAHVNTPRC